MPIKSVEYKFIKILLKFNTQKLNIFTITIVVKYKKFIHKQLSYPVQFISIPTIVTYLEKRIKQINYY